MAVTVSEGALVLDEEYVIVEANSGAQGMFEPYVGHSLWECFPGSRALFLPHYERARRTGAPIEFVEFYDARLVRVRAVPAGKLLEIWWKRLAILDLLTLERLRASLGDALATLERQHIRTLGVVDGGR